MTLVFPLDESRLAFVREVETRSHQTLAVCYQCGKCTAGCPVAYAMDYSPTQIMRGVQLGMRDEVLSSHTIWLCAACETCTTRCPQGVDPAGVMDALRRMAYAAGLKSPESDVPLFHRIFLSGVRLHGRVFETAMLGFYNVLSGHYLKDVVMAPAMLMKGKLSLLPTMDKNIKGMKELFAKARELEAKDA